MAAQQLCPHCGQLHPPGAHFCPEMGTAITRKGSTRHPISALQYLLFGILAVLLAAVGVWQYMGRKIPSNGLPTANPITVHFATSPVLATANRPPLTATATPCATPTSSATETFVLAPTLAFPSATSTPLVPWTACPNSPASRLRIGLRAYVSYDPPDPNRVREQPGTRARVLGQIYPGEIVQILDGPACASGWVWWKVQSKTGLVGWTSEADYDAYWLLPCRMQDNECYASP